DAAQVVGTDSWDGCDHMSHQSTRAGFGCGNRCSSASEHCQQTLSDVNISLSQDQAAEPLVDELSGRLNREICLGKVSSGGADAETDRTVMRGNADRWNTPSQSEVECQGLDIGLPLAKQVDLALDDHSAAKPGSMEPGDHLLAEHQPHLRRHAGEAGDN